MDRFPDEFEDMLTAAGRRVLAGSSPLCGALADPRRRFLAETGLVSERMARAAVGLLNRAVYDLLEPIDRPIPPEAIWEMNRDYGELLPKTARMRTAYLERRRERACRRAEAIGLVAMLRSESFAAFAAALAGRAQGALGHPAAVLRAGRLCRSAQRPPSGRAGGAPRLSRFAHQPLRAWRRPAMAGLCRAGPLQPGRRRGDGRRRHRLPAAAVALHDAAGRL